MSSKLNWLTSIHQQAAVWAEKAPFRQPLGPAPLDESQWHSQASLKSVLPVSPGSPSSHLNRVLTKWRSSSSPLAFWFHFLFLLLLFWGWDVRVTRSNEVFGSLHNYPLIAVHQSDTSSLKYITFYGCTFARYSNLCLALPSNKNCIIKCILFSSLLQ